MELDSTGLPDRASVSSADEIVKSALLISDMEVDSDMQICCKFLLMFLTAFAVGLLYFLAWLSTHNTFPMSRNETQIALMRNYIQQVEKTRKPIRTIADFRKVLTELPVVADSICSDFLQYNCHNWNLLMTNGISYQTFLRDSDNYIHGYYSKAARVTIGVWEPLEQSRNLVRLPTSIHDELKLAMEKCVQEVIDDSAATHVEEKGALFFRYFTLGLCRLASLNKFSALSKELQEFCISGCGESDSEVNWKLICLALSYFVPEVRAAHACPNIATSCTQLRPLLNASCHQ